MCAGSLWKNETNTSHPLPVYTCPITLLVCVSVSDELNYEWMHCYEEIFDLLKKSVDH